jgi:dolichyl-phosphate-mannose-protein mannosyltransferase
MTLQRIDVVGLVGITILAFLLRAAILGQPFLAPTGHVFDERYFVDAACRDLSGQDYLDPQPPLGKLLIAAGIDAGSAWLHYGSQPAPPQGGPACRPQPSGYGTWGWRLASLLFGTALVPLTCLIALALWPNRWFWMSAGLLMTFDGLEFVQSRLGMIDIFAVFFATLAVFLLVLHRRADSTRRWILTGVGLGLVIGLGVATKWTALASWGVAVLVLAGGWLLGRVTVRSGGWHLEPHRSRQVGPSNALDRLWFYIAVLGLVPLAVYMLSYARYLSVPHAIPLVSSDSCDFSSTVRFVPAFNPGDWLREVFMHDRWAIAYHLCQTRIDPNGSPWFGWPLLLHPSVYYRLPPIGPGQPFVSEVWNLGNPALWWVAIPCLAYCAVAGIRDRSFAPMLIVIGYACAWLPFALVPRGLYLYHMLGALPYMVLATAFVLARMASIRFEVSAGQFALTLRGSYIVGLYLLAVIGAFAFFYPMWTGVPLSTEANLQRIWLDLVPLTAAWK